MGILNLPEDPEVQYFKELIKKRPWNYTIKDPWKLEYEK